MQFRERGFDGPYSVAEVNDVDSGYPGVYVLCRRDNVVYVGRSDSDVRARLYSSISAGSYSKFWIRYESSPRQAFLRECRLYHKYNPVDNTIHPDVPEGTFWRCPIRSCEWG